MMRAALIWAGLPSTVCFWSSTVTDHEAPLAALTHWKLRSAARAGVTAKSAPKAATVAIEIFGWLRLGVIADLFPVEKLTLHHCPSQRNCPAKNHWRRRVCPKFRRCGRILDSGFDPSVCRKNLATA